MTRTVNSTVLAQFSNRENTHSTKNVKSFLIYWLHNLPVFLSFSLTVSKESPKLEYKAE